MRSRSPLVSLLSLLALAAASGHALVFGWVSDRNEAPLAGVAVRQVLIGATDTTDAQGAWSLGTVPVGISEAPGPAAPVQLRGNLLRIELPEPSPISVEGLSLDGRRVPLVDVAGHAGANEIVLDPAALRPGTLLRVRTDRGAVVVATSSVTARGAGKNGPEALRAAAVQDTLVFEKAGFETVRRLMTPGQDTFLVTLHEVVPTPTGLQSSILSATAHSISWTAVTGATSYEVRRCSYSGSACTDTSVTNPGYVHYGVAAGSTLRVRVRALRQERSSAWSAELVVHRAPAAPLSRGKSLDTLPAFAMPGLVLVTVPGWKTLRSVRAYNEATPFQDTLLAPDSTIVLRVGGNALPVFDAAWIRVVALDSLGDSGVCRIRVTEGNPDGIAPTTKPHGTNLAEVPFDSAFATVGWDVSDNHVVWAISINGKSLVASGTKSSFLASLRDTLRVGKNVFRLVAFDTAGNQASDSFVVVRLADKVAPKIERTTVPASPLTWVKSLTVVYTITDNDTVGFVTINGVVPTQIGNTYRAAIVLEAGANPIVVIAKDRNGANTSKDSLSITTVLKDRDGNALKFGRMPDGRMWTLQNIQTLPSASSVGAGSQAACANDSCAKYGRQYSWAMAMDLPASCDQGSCRQADSLSHQGLCPSGWHVPTDLEWSRLVTAAAGGASDSIGMSRLMSRTAEGKWYSWSRVTCEPVSYTERNFSGSNTFGFTLLPSHSGSSGGQCGSGGNTYSRFWRATETSGTNAATTVWNGRVEGLTSPKAAPSVLRCIAN